MTEKKNQWGFTPTEQAKAIEEFERKYPKGKGKEK